MPKILTQRGVAERDLAGMRFTQQAADRHRAGREGRLSELERRAAVIRNAHMALGRLTADCAGRNFVRLRPGLYSTERREPVAERVTDPALSPQKAGQHPGALASALRNEVSGRAPLGRLIHRPGPSTTLELVAVAVVQMLDSAGRREDLAEYENVFGGDRSWGHLIGDPEAGERLRRHVVDALKRLRDLRLIQLRSPATAQPNWRGWDLLDEDGSGRRYTVPEDGLDIPIEFWTQGWLHVLEPTEVAVYLMLADLRRQLPGHHERRGVGAPPSRRRAEYGISDETYSAYNELVEFGLITKEPSVHDKRAGRIPKEVAQQVRDGRVQLDVERFRIVDDGLRTPAVDKVMDVLKQHPTPTRFEDFDPLRNLVANR